MTTVLAWYLELPLSIDLYVRTNHLTLLYALYINLEMSSTMKFFLLIRDEDVF